MFLRQKKQLEKTTYPVLIKILLFALIFISSIWLISEFNKNADIRMHFTDTSDQYQSKDDLEDILLSDRKPTPGRSIFFHETSYRLPGSHNDHHHHHQKLNARQACAIESAALSNPNYDVYVLFVGRTQRHNVTAQPLLESISSYSNIYLRNLNLWTYAAGTPIYDWLKKGHLFSSHYLFSHTSDLLRYLTLWRWGGTYLDLDVIVKKCLENIPPNYSGPESDSNIAAGIMNFAADGFGHEVANLCLHDFQQNFDGQNWGNNGPGVITRVLQKICQTKSPALMTRERCLQFNVYPKDAFYAIRWQDWKYFFETEHLEETLNRTKDSIIVHVWNMHSKNYRIKVGSNVAYGKLAAEFCPKVYASCGEYF